MCSVRQVPACTAGIPVTCFWLSGRQNKPQNGLHIDLFYCRYLLVLRYSREKTERRAIDAKSAFELVACDVGRGPL